MSIQQNDTDSEKTFVKQFTSTEEEQEFCMRYDIMRNDLEKFQLFCKSYRISKILKSPGKFSFQQSLEDQQFFNLFRSLETNSVRYLVAGGLAMLAYGHSFADTSYIDIWIEDTSTNRKNLRQSFSKAGYGDFQEIETHDLNDCRLVVFIYGSFPIRIFTVIEGAENQLFNFCHEKAEIVNFVGVSIHFMDINDLISSKKSVSRPKDQIDLIELEKIRKIRQQSEDKKTF